VLIEAAACGRPIVTTDTPGCREIVHHGVNGLLVPPRNPRALADAIKSLLPDRKTCIAMGKKGRQRVEQGFSMAAVNDATLAVYRRVCPYAVRPTWP
jgi:glycosyltransferase involved in cell wall biosynthesis